MSDGRVVSDDRAGNDDWAVSDDRAVSEVLGYALIFAIILVSITVVSVSGVGSLQTARDAEQLNNAERAFGVLADNTEDIYKRDAPSRATELSIGPAQLFTGTNTTIEIRDGGTTLREFTVTPLVFRTGEDNEIVYEAGAVFRTRRDAGRIVRPPPHHWGENRRILTIVATLARNTQSVAGTDVVARMKARRKAIELDGSTSISDPRVYVASQRADLWKRYLDERAGIDGDCTEVSDTEIECDIVGGGPNLLVTVHEIEMRLEQ